ncbi:M20 family metallopeptidase [Actinomadura viridis]|uniref:Probable succinyl-diaminopimelate desuccinylase n=1 Tax=Actinomadura viridis TaxID=58110 RepID=A0A931DR04_9ACTN|nr:M20 family metallopeptidase [Actinomadura viridis]MBG6093163.1 acetylornithine deacetylase [Actinomadura viridis]
MEASSSEAPARCVEQIDRDRLARTLCELIELPSVNPFGGVPQDADQGEGRVAAYLHDRLVRLGWTSEIDEYAPGRFNTLARLPGTSGGRSLMLAGHMDTVETTGYPEALTGVVRDGKVYGRGACDMKAALACYLEVAEILAERSLRPAGDLLIAGVGDEEYRQEGAKALGASGPPADAVIIGEPTELTACLATKGLAAFELRVTGEATHSSVPQHGTNAILAAARLLGRLEEHQRTLDRRRHPLLGPPTMNVGVIEGGIKPNIVPSECRVQFSRRLLPGENPSDVRADVVADLEPGAWSLGEAWWTVAPYELPEGHWLAAALLKAAELSEAPDPSPRGFPASSDAAYFGSPVALFGPGSLAQAHSLDEWVSISDMVTATAVYLRTASLISG